MKSVTFLPLLPCVHSFAIDFGYERNNMFALGSTPLKRIPRRDLKKRSRKNRDGKSKTFLPNEPEVDTSMQITEIRPLVRSRSIEAGEDYWIDEDDLKKSIERENAIKNRKALEGEISQEKLVSEVVAPYKQNWIGLISVFVVTISFIVSKFPELLDTPQITIPDL
jgi:hypothetical protein